MSQLPFPSLDAVVDGQRLSVIVAGEERLALLIDTISAARQTLRLYFYIFADGRAGQQVIDALIEARNRDVKVTLLVDGFGTDDQPDSVYAPLVEAGVNFARFFPRYGRRYLLRNHQKILIADDRYAVVGGSNIEDSYFFDSGQEPCWHDLYIRIEGASVARLAAYFDALSAWMALPNPGLRGLTSILARYSESEGPIRWVFGGPFRRLNPLARALRSDIARAQAVHIIQAYFAPNWGFLRKLARVARTGRLHLISAARSDNQTTIAAARHCYRRLLRNGAAIHEYERQRLHMKLIVADDAVYAGSANFDMRSLYLNTEIMVRIDDPEFAAKMRTFAEGHTSHSATITRESHRAASGWFARLRWLFGYLVITALDYRLARNLNWKES